MVAPCPHDGKCPLVGTKDVCGYSQRLQRPSFLRKTKHSSRGEEEKGYCYLVIAKGERPSVGTVAEDMKVAGRMGKVGREAAEKALIKSQGRSIIQEVEGHEAVMEVVRLHEIEPGMENYFEETSPSVNSEELEENLRKEAYSWPRMVAPPMKRKGHVTMDTCCADGELQRANIQCSTIDISQVTYNVLPIPSRIPSKATMTLVNLLGVISSPTLPKASLLFEPVVSDDLQSPKTMGMRTQLSANSYQQAWRKRWNSRKLWRRWRLTS